MAQTLRMQFAKRLIDETTMPLTEIAFAAGFGSVRRFHAVVQAQYGRAPSELRKVHRPASAFRLAVREPFDWASMLGFLRARAIPGVEEVDETMYRRWWAGAEITIRFQAPHLLISMDGASRGQWLDILRRVRRLFDVAADLDVINATLSLDPLLRPLVLARPGLRVPGAWDPFEIGVRAILGQQVTVAGARTLAGRLVAAYGQMPTAAQLVDADLSAIGLPGSRQETLRAYARAVLAQNETLENVRGIGPWTRDYYAMRALGEPDAFPAGDLVLRKATGLNEKQLLARAEGWRPWRAYAALHIWRGQS